VNGSSRRRKDEAYHFPHPGTCTGNLGLLQSLLSAGTHRSPHGTEPYEAAVTRSVPGPTSLPEAVLTQLFLGPSESETAQGLAVVLSGTTGFSKLSIEERIARVYLTGTCSSQGATYTIANLIFANLKQFPEIQWIKIYDQNNETEVPDGQSDSIPVCLEP
jgi:hypothetical protein